MIVLVITTFVAALVTGMAGYGFSSITVPVCLQFFGRATLNPMIVLIEVGSNSYTVFANRGSLSKVWKRGLSILIGLGPGAILGALLLKHIAESPARLATLVFLGILVAFRSAGFKKPIHYQGKIGIAFGGILGLIYSLTTISGPPLSIALTNDGFSREELKALVGMIRVVESSFAAITYLYIGIFNAESMHLIRWILPGVIIGMPLGSALAKKVKHDLFRRFCIAGDAWLISFGLAKSLPAPLNWILTIPIICFDAFHLRKFFSDRKQTFASAAVEPGPLKDREMTKSA